MMYKKSFFKITLAILVLAMTKSQLHGTSTNTSKNSDVERVNEQRLAEGFVIGAFITLFVPILAKSLYHIFEKTKKNQKLAAKQSTKKPIIKFPIAFLLCWDVAFFLLLGVTLLVMLSLSKRRLALCHRFWALFRGASRTEDLPYPKIAWANIGQMNTTFLNTIKGTIENLSKYCCNCLWESRLLLFSSTTPIQALVEKIISPIMQYIGDFLCLAIKWALTPLYTLLKPYITCIANHIPEIPFLSKPPIDESSKKGFKKGAYMITTLIGIYALFRFLKEPFLYRNHYQHLCNAILFVTAIYYTYQQAYQHINEADRYWELCYESERKIQQFLLLILVPGWIVKYALAFQPKKRTKPMATEKPPVEFFAKDFENNP